MAYQKQTWRDFDDTKTDLQNINNGAVVTTERLNHIENGIANSADKAEVTAQLQQTDKNITDLFINVFFPPNQLTPLKVDGLTDETVEFQNLLDYVGENGGGTLYIPQGVLISTVNYIPNNVVLLGGGVGRTTIKLKDGFIGDSVRKVAGLYPKFNVDYFEIRNLTYDGNAEKNINLLYEDDYDRLFAHGIVNYYVDPDVDPYEQSANPDPLATAKDFYIDHVHIKNTARNSLLFGGTNNNIGLIGSVKLENAFLDHFIYESGTNSKITYQNITTIGTWRGAGIVASNGTFGDIKHIKPIKSPSRVYEPEAYFSPRFFNVGGAKTSVNIKKMTLDLLFEGLNAVISEGTARCGYTINDITVNQLDDIKENIYGIPVSFLLALSGNSVTIGRVELNNVMAINLLFSQETAENYTFNEVSINYNPLRKVPFVDTILTIGNREPGSVKNITIKNVTIKEKAPRLLHLRVITDNRVDVENVNFSNLSLRTTGATNVFEDSTNNSIFIVLKNIIVKDSNVNGYVDMDMETLLNKKIKFLSSIVNDLNTVNGKDVSLTLESGWGGSITASKDDRGYVQLITTNLTVGVTGTARPVATLPTGYSPLPGRIIPFSVFNNTKQAISSGSFVISGSTGQILLYATTGIDVGDQIRFVFLYKG